MWCVSRNTKKESGSIETGSNELVVGLSRQTQHAFLVCCACVVSLKQGTQLLRNALILSQGYFPNLFATRVEFREGGKALCRGPCTDCTWHELLLATGTSPRSEGLAACATPGISLGCLPFPSQIGPLPVVAHVNGADPKAGI